MWEKIAAQLMVTCGDRNMAWGSSSLAFQGKLTSLAFISFGLVLLPIMPDLWLGCGRGHLPIIKCRLWELKWLLINTYISSCQYKWASHHQTSILFTEKPKVTVMPRNQSFTGGSEVSIMCSATGYPKPKIVWTINEMFILGSHRYWVCIIFFLSTEWERLMKFWEQVHQTQPLVFKTWKPLTSKHFLNRLGNLKNINGNFKTFEVINPQFQQLRSNSLPSFEL